VRGVERALLAAGTLIEVGVAAEGPRVAAPPSPEAAEMASHEMITRLEALERSAEARRAAAERELLAMCGEQESARPNKKTTSATVKTRRKKPQARRPVAAVAPREPAPAAARDDDDDDDPAAPADDSDCCVVCQDAGRSIALVPCGHVCCCGACAPALSTCPMCRADVDGRVRLYF